MSNTDVPQKIYKDTPIANVTVFDAEKSIGIIWKKSTEELREDLREFLDRGKGNLTNF